MEPIISAYCMLGSCLPWEGGGPYCPLGAGPLAFHDPSDMGIDMKGE